MASPVLTGPRVAVILTALTAFLTWPQALHLATHVADHNDAYFSLWRLAWVAHALRGNIGHLFDGNIFHPAAGTLAYSDAMLLEGTVAAPLIWAHVPIVLVYNLLLFAGIVASGLGMFLLVRRLTGDAAAALVSAAMFTVIPYRIEHFMHLELQWTVWMPLAFWAVHRVFDDGRVRNGVLVGMLVFLQMMSSVYYGVFLAILVAIQIGWLASLDPQRARTALPPLAIGAVAPAVLVALYARPYLANAQVLGPRNTDEIANFSAHLASYVAAPPQNWLWGWTGTHVTGNELHLFPGIATIVFAACAFLHPARRLVWMYAGLFAAAVVLSLGLNGPVYAWLHAHVSALSGFRAPARFGILAGCALSVIAGFGFEAIRGRFARASAQRMLLPAVVAVVTLESGSAPLRLIDVPRPDSDVYTFLRAAYPSVVLELPMVEWDLTTNFMYWSTAHWNPLVNGYSGHEPPSYKATSKLMETFPDDPSMARLKDLGVRFIVVHEAFYKPEKRSALMVQMAEREDLLPTGRFRSPMGTAQVFELKR